MQELITYVNNMVRHATEVLYYIRKEEYQLVYNLSLSFLSEIEKYIKKAQDICFEESIDLLLPSYERLKKIIKSYKGDTDFLYNTKKIYSREFIKKLSYIEIFLLEENGCQIQEYYEENMTSLCDSDNIYNKRLYEIINNEKKEISDVYEVGITRTGDITLSVDTDEYGKVKICSSGNPWQEALLYVEFFNTKDKIENIYVLGFGLGYHVQCLTKKYPKSNIIVLENDLSQIKIALKYRDLRELFSNKKVKLIYCEKAKDYAEYLQEIDSICGNDNKNTVLLKTWKPSIKTITDDQLREVLENYELIFESMKRMEGLLDENFRKNIALKDDYIDEIREHIKGKNVIVIAGGSSLDENISLIKKLFNDSRYLEIKENIRLLCVGKVSRKLLENGIRPDYIIITDPKPGTRWQLSGIENSGIPLIYISTAAANVVSDYCSKRYIVYQDGMPQAEKIAEKNKVNIYSSGGSVTTLAIDIAIRLKAKRIICVGVDMGYKGENTHADGVGRKIANKEVLKEVDAVGGGRILTGKTLNVYRKWIEKRIRNEYGTEFINSSAGAKISGMKEHSLQKIVEQIGKETRDEKKI